MCDVEGRTGGKGLAEECLYSRQAVARIGFKKITVRDLKCGLPDRRGT